MQPIEIANVQKQIEKFMNHVIYLHLETSTGSYVGVQDPDRIPTCAYIRNGRVICSEGKIVDNEGVFAVGLKIDSGWIYAQGVTDWEITADEKLLLGGHDKEGNLNIGLELSFQPFICGD